MEADWEFDIGGDAPVIEADWPEFVNLRDEPERIRDIEETQHLPGLARILMELNAKQSPVWTSKCDVFEPEAIDPNELEADSEEGKFALAGYIDVLMRNDQAWDSLFKVEQACRSLCNELHEIPLRCCRVDIVVRKARVRDLDKLGATVYFLGCGPTRTDSENRLVECMAKFATVMVS